MKFEFSADITFHAEDITDALKQISDHFAMLALLEDPDERELLFRGSMDILPFEDPNNE